MRHTLKARHHHRNPSHELVVGGPGHDGYSGVLMGITGVEPDRTSALVLEILDAPQVVALARDSTDVQILTVDPEAAAATWLGSLPTSPPAHVVADVRAVRALLADESGRSWLAG